MKSSITIYGGKPLRGEVELSGAKNSGFKLLIPALFCREPSQIINLSLITDLKSTMEMIADLGGQVDFVSPHSVRVSGGGLNSPRIKEKFAGLSRAAIYFVGPLLAKFGKAYIPVLGGCNIGRRPLDRHLDGFRALGVQVTTSSKGLVISGKFQGGYYRFPKVTHGGTDSLLIASALSSGKTVLDNVAQEPEVDDLIGLLSSMGARIKRLPKRRIIVEGVKSLRTTSYRCMADRNEAVTFAAAALASQGDIFIKGITTQLIATFLKKVTEAGGGWEANKGGIRFFYRGPLKATSVTTGAHPAFMTDWQALWAILMTQAKGKSEIRETVFENRFGYVPYARKFGAKMRLFNPRVKNRGKYYNFNLEDDRPQYFHALQVIGPTKLQGVRTRMTDLRSGATLLLASLLAAGQSVIENGEMIERGYENLVGKFQALGASIKVG